MNPTVFTLNIRKPIDKTFYSYSFEIPVALYVSGSAATDVSGNFRAIVSVPTISVVYGGQPFILSETPIINTTNLITDISGTASGVFNGALYIGKIGVSNMILLTNPSSTYDVIFNYAVSTTKDTNITSITTSMYTNVGALFATSNVLVNGMTFITSPSIVSNPPLILTGL
jgi:hypothetical protein